MKRSQRLRMAGPEPLALAPDHDGERAAQVGLAGGQRCIRLRAGDAQAAGVEVGQCAGKVVHRAQQEMLDRAGRGLDRGRSQRRLAAGREDDAVHPGRLGAAQQRADILRILERIEHEDEWRLAALGGAGEDVRERREPSRLDHERDTLVAIEAGDRRQRATLDLDDRDAQASGVEHQLLERLPPLRHDQQAVRRPPGGEDLLDRAATGHQLLVRPEQVRRGQALAGRAMGRGRRLPRPRTSRRRARGPYPGPGRYGAGVAGAARGAPRSAAGREADRSAGPRTAAGRLGDRVGGDPGSASPRLAGSDGGWRSGGRAPCGAFGGRHGPRRPAWSRGTPGWPLSAGAGRPPPAGPPPRARVGAMGRARAARSGGRRDRAGRRSRRAGAPDRGRPPGPGGRHGPRRPALGPPAGRRAARRALGRPAVATGRVGPPGPAGPPRPAARPATDAATARATRHRAGPRSPPDRPSTGLAARPRAALPAAARSAARVGRAPSSSRARPCQPRVTSTHAPPSLAVAGVLDGHAQLGQLVAQAVGGGPIARRACRGPGLEQGGRAGSRSSARVRQDRRAPRSRSRSASSARRRRRSTATVARSGG